RQGQRAEKADDEGPADVDEDRSPRQLAADRQRGHGNRVAGEAADRAADDDIETGDKGHGCSFRRRTAAPTNDWQEASAVWLGGHRAVKGGTPSPGARLGEGEPSRQPRAPMSAATISIDTDDDGARLDRWFKRHHPGLSHGALEKLLRTGQVRLDGKR